MTALEAYARHAEEYAELLGALDAMAPADVRRIETWAGQVAGRVLDLGCGPGHWTAHLVELGHQAEGWDPVDEFVGIARHRHPGVVYRRAALADLDGQHGRWGGILAWYSLIHLEPAEMPRALTQLRQGLRPSGTLLLGFFDGPRQESFDHAVAPAQHWPVARLVEIVEEAGLEVVDVETRQDPGSRPHAALQARRPDGLGLAPSLGWGAWDSALRTAAQGMRTTGRSAARTPDTDAPIRDSPQ
ncbi:class I SAM-dependent methyltransferase [Brachybacterium saurashtrense]|uniref:Class I SAM-dependent methyltransferase n=1 Tax=Brachybacterium saurashtrense TaxID=556288 RepID=A0A345YLD6_9MICO|nr:class I SAM-dependent methyltransferase [Brachybacterium saurashtrense]AXK44738.1 class I SAM-dependent methyltransferase [Brachybacterium saurashtrense]RRR23350.1 class I SAM-dependent methyltransferase [Brachybacterium saurashtrense]